MIINRTPTLLCNIEQSTNNECRLTDGEALLAQRPAPQENGDGSSVPNGVASRSVLATLYLTETSLFYYTNI